MKKLNQEISDGIKSKNLTHFNRYKIRNIFYSLNSVYFEINEYNNNYWSKFLLVFLFLVITLIDSFLYQAIFGRMSIIIKFAFLYAAIFYAIVLLITLNITSSVTFEAFKAYKLLHKLFILNMKIRLLIYKRFNVCIK